MFKYVKAYKNNFILLSTQKKKKNGLQVTPLKKYFVKN